MNLDPELGQLDLYVQVPFSKLEFESSPNGFRANYSIRAEVSTLDERGRPLSVIQAPVWDQSITVPIHAETQSITRADLDRPHNWTGAGIVSGRRAAVRPSITQ